MTVPPAPCSIVIFSSLFDIFLLPAGKAYAIKYNINRSQIGKNSIILNIFSNWFH